MAVLSDSEAALRWDALVASFQPLAFEQGYHWGEYRSAFGWRPLRCVFSSSEGVWGLSQCLVRKLGSCRIAVVWVPGGPLLRKNHWRAVRDAIAGLFEGWRVYLRIDPPGSWSDPDAGELGQSGWKLVPTRLNSGQTVIMSLEEEEKVRRSRLSGNWRHNLVRGERQGVTVTCRRGLGDAAILEQLYGKMAAFKGFGPLMDGRSIRHMLQVLGDRFMVAVAQDRGGRVIAARGAGWLGSHGQDLFAATPQEGRRCYASYVTLWCLLEELRAIGVKTYNLGGIDPDNNPGVYNFKRGVGGVEVRRLGEWEWSNSPVLARAVNAWVRARGMAVT